MKINLERLPRTARLLAEIVGHEAMLAMVQAYGGRTIWPAKRGEDFAALAGIMGEEAAHAFVAHYRDPVYVPRCDGAIRAAMRDYVRSEFDGLVRGGMSARKAVAALAGRPPHRYTDRYIWTILSTVEDGQVVDASQSDLF